MSLQMSKIQDVFKTKGTPTVTYVHREKGRFEKQLSAAIDDRGTFCLITGPSKAGKTSLYTKVIENKKKVLLKILCDNNLSTEDIWKKVLDKLKYERVDGISTSNKTTSSLGAKIVGGITWPFTHISGEVSTEKNKEKEKTEHKERIVSDPSSDHVAILLKNSKYCLVIDGIHNLKPDVRQTLFQQLKTFVDEEVSIVGVASTHHMDEETITAELSGRLSRMKLYGWKSQDLLSIITQGFDYLRIPKPKDELSEMIVKESVGLPIITQGVCKEILREKVSSGDKVLSIGHNDAIDAFYNLATRDYSDYESIYNLLIRGPREKTRQYDTYKYILTACSQDPIVFSLNRENLEERIKKINAPNRNLPPAGSLIAALDALDNLQKKLGRQLLHWNKAFSVLEITELSFLSYMRWREKRNSPPTPDEVLATLL